MKIPKIPILDIQGAMREMTIKVARNSERFFGDNFRRQGFLDATLEKWRQRKREDAGRAILVKSGALRRSIFIEVASRGLIRLASNLPYSSVHNEGTAKMPQRKFMGQSKALDQENIKIIMDISKRYKK
jgi:phage gpG-like protein